MMSFLMKVLILVSVLQHFSVANRQQHAATTTSGSTRMLDSVFSGGKDGGGGGEDQDETKGDTPDDHRNKDNPSDNPNIDRKGCYEEIPEGGCSVCGAGRCVTNSEAVFSFPGKPSVSCGMLQDAGFQGLVPLTECKYLPPLIGVCQCAGINESSSNNNGSMGAGGVFGISIAILFLVGLCVVGRIKLVQWKQSKQAEPSIDHPHPPKSTFADPVGQFEQEEEEQPAGEAGTTPAKIV